VVFQKDSGTVTDADKLKFDELTTTLEDANGVAPTVEGEMPSVLGPTYSEDGEAVEYLVFFDASGEELLSSITDVRAELKDITPTGFTSYVTLSAALLVSMASCSSLHCLLCLSFCSWCTGHCCCPSWFC
jgi:hypothetical protein